MAVASRQYIPLLLGFLFLGVGDVYATVAVLVARHFPDAIGAGFGVASSVYMLVYAHDTRSFTWYSPKNCTYFHHTISLFLFSFQLFGERVGAADRD